MSKKFLFAFVAVMLLSAMIVPAAFAQSATGQAWVSSITFYTPSSAGGTLSISFYAEGSATPITIPDITLKPHAAGSLFVGGVTTLPSPFKGTAVLSSGVNVVATAVQMASGAEQSNYPRSLYTGFSDADAAAKVYIPTVLVKKFGFTSTVAVQNVESFAVNANVKVYAVGATTPTVNKDFVIKPLSNVILIGGNNAGALNLPAGFNGSAVITGTKNGAPATEGKLVATSEETEDAGRGAYAFEGVAAGANKIYMASMLCNATSDPATSYYAIQNTSLVDKAFVTMDFYDTTGQKIGSMPQQEIGPGNKFSPNPCTYGVPNGKLGSAVINSTGAAVIAIGKVKSNGGIATAFVGQAAGVQKLAAPYIRWSATPAGYRTFVAVMNVGDADAVSIQAKYYDGNGTLKATHSLATAAKPLKQYIKTNTNPFDAHALQADGTFGLPTGSIPGGGSIEITSDQPLVVVVRAQSDVSLGSTTRFAEDYNGVAIP
jgi:hypothetical protein